MFAGCLQLMWVYWQLIRVEGVGYLQIIRAENTDVCSSYGLCLQAVTAIHSGHFRVIFHDRISIIMSGDFEWNTQLTSNFCLTAISDDERGKN